MKEVLIFLIASLMLTQVVISQEIPTPDPILNQNSKELDHQTSEQPSKEISVQNESHEESVKEEPVKDEPVKDEPVKEEPVKEEPVKEEPVKEEPVKDEPVKEEPVKEEPVKEEPVKDEPVKDEPTGGESVTFYITKDSYEAIQSIGKALDEVDSEVKINCLIEGDKSPCLLSVWPEKSPELDIMLINHPFEKKIHVLRIYGGTQVLQQQLYQALEPFSETVPFKESWKQRQLKLENKALNFRCTSTLEENPIYECWIILGRPLFE